MEYKPKSIRAFIGAKDFDKSRQFYTDLGFQEVAISEDMSLFKTSDFGFYLQKYYIKDWVDNSMIFLEVEDLESHLRKIRHISSGDKEQVLRKSQNNKAGKEQQTITAPQRKYV